MTWWQDRKTMLAACKEHDWNLAEVARRSGAKHQTLAKWFLQHGLAEDRPYTTDQMKARNGRTSDGKVRTPPPSVTPKGVIQKPGARITQDAATLVSRPNPRGTATLTPEALMREHGLDPDDWEYQATANAWDALAGDGGVTTLSQLKLVCKRRVHLDLILPARTAGWIPTRPTKPLRGVRKVATWVVVSDLHAPYHDKGLHQAFCKLLADVQPEHAVDLGDMTDLPKPSRHRPTPGWDASPNDCLTGAWRVWGERVAASPRTKWQALAGNHDLRLEIAARERLPELEGLKRAGADLSVLDLGYLLRLDELGVELIRPKGEYHAAQVDIAPGLIGRHGTATNNRGASTGASKAVERLTCSVLQGHDHRQGLTYLTRWDGEEEAGDAVAVSVGAACRRKGGLGYAVDPNWVNGCAIVTVWPDGVWHVELAHYTAGALLWRDRRYEG